MKLEIQDKMWRCRQGVEKLETQEASESWKYKFRDLFKRLTPAMDLKDWTKGDGWDGSKQKNHNV